MMNKKRRLEETLQALENEEHEMETIAEIKRMSEDIPEPNHKMANKADFLALVEAEGARLRQAGAAPRAFALFRDRIRTRLSRLTVAAAALLLMTGGVAVAAGPAGPTDTLYPVKKIIESARQVLPQTAYSSAALHLSLAETRLGEIQNLKQKDEKLATVLTSELRFHLNKGREAAKRLSAEERKAILSKLKIIEDQVDRRSPGKTKPATITPDADESPNEGTEEDKIKSRTDLDMETLHKEQNDAESGSPTPLPESPTDSVEPPEAANEPVTPS